MAATGLTVGALVVSGLTVVSIINLSLCCDGAISCACLLWKDITVENLSAESLLWRGSAVSNTEILAGRLSGADAYSPSEGRNRQLVFWRLFYILLSY